VFGVALAHQTLNLIIYSHKQKNFNIMPQYKLKVVKSGNHLEVYEYQKYIYRGYFEKPKHTFINPQKQIIFLDEDKEVIRREDNLNRTKKTIKRLINSNPDMNKFITLTFAENLTDVKKANYKFKKFMQRLKYHYGDFKYLCVIEFQKRGSVHYHFVSSLPIPQFKNLNSFYFVNGKKKRKKSIAQKRFEVDFADKFWHNGFVDCTTLKNVDNIGAYISKYLGKETHQLLYKKKKFFYSKNTLEKSIEIICKQAIDFLFQAYKIVNIAPKFSTRFYSDFAGIVKYSYFQLCPI